jgi:hypothetical protein
MIIMWHSDAVVVILIVNTASAVDDGTICAA